MLIARAFNYRLCGMKWAERKSFSNYAFDQFDNVIYQMVQSDKLEIVRPYINYMDLNTVLSITNYISTDNHKTLQFSIFICKPVMVDINSKNFLTGTFLRNSFIRKQVHNPSRVFNYYVVLNFFHTVMKETHLLNFVKFCRKETLKRQLSRAWIFIFDL